MHYIYTMVYVVVRTIFLGGGTGVFLRPGGRLSEAEEERAESCSCASSAPGSSVCACRKKKKGTLEALALLRRC